MHGVSSVAFLTWWRVRYLTGAVDWIVWLGLGALEFGSSVGVCLGATVPHRRNAVSYRNNSKFARVTCHIMI